MRFEVIENVTNEYMTMAIEGSSKATVIVSYEGLGPENHLVFEWARNYSIFNKGNYE